jgi:hypothetical protein
VSTGDFRGLVSVLSPSCPWTLLPQDQTSPFDFKTDVNKSPARTAVTFASDGTSAIVVRDVVDPSPS